MAEPIKYRKGFVAVPTWTSIENPELDRLRNEAAFAELVCEMAHRVNGEHLATDDVIRATGVELRDMVRSIEDGHKFAAELASLRRKAVLWDAICEKYSKLAEHNAPQPLATKMGLYSQRLVREYLGV